MTDNIFDGSDPNPEPKADNTDPLVTKLMEIKNEDGQQKYATVEVALDALANSQQYIPTLKTEKEALEKELAELRAKQESQGNVEDVVNKLLEQRDTANAADQQAPAGLNEDSVAEIVRKQLEADKAQAQIQLNANKVTEALEAQFGEKAREEIARKATELGTTPQALGELATQSPDLVISLFKQAGSAPVNPTASSQSTSQFRSEPKVELEKPAKSLLSGATAKEQQEYMAKVKAKVYADLGVVS